MRTVLIVEDEAVTALDLKEMLSELGYGQVGVTDTGEAAVTLAQEKHPDLVLMDIHLKGAMDGITAARQIWDKLQIPIVFLTSYSDEGTLNRAKLAQPFGYLLKPYDQDELRTTLELAFHRIDMQPNASQTTSAAEHEQPQFDLPPSGSAKGSPTYDFLRRVDPFRRLPEGDLATFAASCSFRTLEAGQVLIRDSAIDAVCFIVAAGRIACVKGSNDGKELIVQLLPPGDILGVILGLDEEPYPFSVRAERDSTVLILPPVPLQTLLQKHPTMYQDFNQLMTERMKDSLNLSCRLAHSRVEIRIAKALLVMLGDFGKFDSQTGSHWIDITRQELAHLVGTTPETAIRVTKAMEGHGILNLAKPSRIGVIKLEALEALSTEAAFDSAVEREVG